MGEGTNTNRGGQPLISVIVPVYNGASVLGESLGNLLHQTYPNMEIILVDDASTDDTWQVLQSAKEQFPDRVVLLRQEKNAGPGAARNLGIEAARGDYIGFVDADDRVDVTMYEKLYDLIKKEEADIADCAFFQESKEAASIHFSEDCCGDLDGKKRSDLIAGGGFAVTKLFDKAFFRDCGLRYRPEYVLEDMDFIMLAICCAGRVAGTEEVLYIYRDRDDSQSKESDPGRYVMACASAMVAIYERVGALPEYEDILEACEYAMLSLYSDGINMCLYQAKKNPAVTDAYKQLLNTLKQLRGACITRDIKKNHYVRQKMDASDLAVVSRIDSGTSMEKLLEEMDLQEEVSVDLADEDPEPPDRNQVMEAIKYDIGLAPRPRNRKRREVLFLPYKASMWDSLESVWKKADADPNTDAYVIPIPYYDRKPDGRAGQMHCEAGLFPENVPVINCCDYDFENRHPDEIYIHNPYDGINRVTAVHPYFYSKNLKRFTEKLVYIPYFVLAEPDPENPDSIKGMSHFVTVPAVINADEVIVQSENMRLCYIEAMCDFAGEETRSIWEAKIKGYGSPKLERIAGLTEADITIPKEWEKYLLKPDGSRKKVILYNTSVGALLANSDKMLDKMRRVFEIFRENADEVALLWRPHPLIVQTIEAQRPELLEDYMSLVSDYKKSDFGIYDDTPDLDRALVMADAYYGDGSSLVQLCQKRGIPIMIQSVDV